MRPRNGFDKTKIARFEKEGCGPGFGGDYKLSLTIRDEPSRDRSHRLLDWAPGGVNHLLSDLARSAVLIYDFRDDLRDIREQFPLDRDETKSIAESTGICHPVDSKSLVALVQTTDLVINLERDGRSVTLARSIKPSSERSKAQTVEKLEIERRYLHTRGIDWGLITERELPPVLLRNLELLQACTSLDDLSQPFEGYYRERAGLIAAELENWPQAVLQQFCQAMDTRLGLEPGGTLLLVRHLLASRSGKRI